ILKPDPRTGVTGGVVLARIFEEAGLPAGAVTFSIVEGRIAELRWVVNPDKLAGLASGTADRPNMG
ncbi:MAG TPA: hypothetical protein VF869_08145, partial [Jatrophihabitantaceae bacterium]